MKVLKIQYCFYIERKIPTLGNYKVKEKTSIHKVINAKVSYDPFLMKRKGTKRHNDFNLLRLSYRNYKLGIKTKHAFLDTLTGSKYLFKYLKRFM